MNSYLDHYMQLTANTIIVKKILHCLAGVLQVLILVFCAVRVRSNQTAFSNLVPNIPLVFVSNKTTFIRVQDYQQPLYDAYNIFVCDDVKHDTSHLFETSIKISFSNLYRMFPFKVTGYTHFLLTSNKRDPMQLVQD